MEPMTIQEIAAAVGGKWLNPREGALPSAPTVGS